MLRSYHRATFIAILTMVSNSVLGQAPGVGTSPSPPPLSAAERFNDLDMQGLKQFHGHVELAEYLQLRRQLGQKRLTDPGSEIVDFARKNLNVPYARNAYMMDLQAADCVTWMEMVLALALTDIWEDAYRLAFRLRFKDGQRIFRNLNHYPIADWLPNNAWLFEDVTENLRAATAQYDVHTDRREKHLRHLASRDESFDANAESAAMTGPTVSLTTTYIVKDEWRRASRLMRDGDLVFFVANYPDPLDHVERPMCVHQAIAYFERGQLRLLHCVKPAAEDSPFEEYTATALPRDRYLGFKVARVREDAYGLVREELRQRQMQAVTPAERDADFQTRGTDGSSVFVQCARAPNRESTIDGVVYGVVNLQPGETLYSLFKRAWKRVYELPLNAPFRQLNPNPDTISPGPTPILYPIRNAADQ